jgi:hypothetical protein
MEFIIFIELYNNQYNPMIKEATALKTINNTIRIPPILKILLIFSSPINLYYYKTSKL